MVGLRISEYRRAAHKLACVVEYIAVENMFYKYCSICELSWRATAGWFASG